MIEGSTVEPDAHEETLRPRRVLASPLFWAALVVLATNDHLLKGSGLAPTWFTGKASDVAGLFLAPAVFAALVRVRGARGFAACHVLVGLVFAGIKLSPSLAQAWDGLVSLLIPSKTTVDPTDLAALPSLLASYVVFGRVARSPGPARATRTWLSRAGLVLGSLACVASSPLPFPQTQVAGLPGRTRGSVVLRFTENTNGLLLTVRSPTAPLDCEKLLSEKPEAALDASSFQDKSMGYVYAGDDVALAGNQSGCGAALVHLDYDGPLSGMTRRMSWTYIVWSTIDHPLREVQVRAESTGEIANGTIVVKSAPGGSMAATPIVLERHGAMRVIPVGDQP
jgi:hypothetical protein